MAMKNKSETKQVFEDFANDLVNLEKAKQNDSINTRPDNTGATNGGSKDSSEHKTKIQ
jgi:hypothetical protein